MMLELQDLSFEIASNMRLDKKKKLMQKRPVSSVGRALVCRAGWRGLKHPGQTNYKGLKQLVRLYWLWLKILFRFTLYIASLGGDVKPLAMSPSSFLINWNGT